MKLEAILVFLGGGIGSLMRYGLGLLLNKENIPFGTLTSNMLGSLIIGIFFGYHFRQAAHFFTENQVAFLAVGILGGFTTFSSFMYENLQFLFNEQYYRFIGYSLLTLFLGFLMVAIGYYLGKILPL